jgi:hypothetical protein
MSTTSRRLPLSLPNILIVGACLLGGIAAGILQNIPGAVLLLLLGIGGLVSALLARRAGASDWLRVNAIEYRDERDRRLAGRGFAVVGAWALALSVVELVAATVLLGAISQAAEARLPATDLTLDGAGLVGAGVELLAALQVLTLSIVWGVANTRAVKRG